jgi:hypothetical protein
LFAQVSFFDCFLSQKINETHNSEPVLKILTNHVSGGIEVAKTADKSLNIKELHLNFKCLANFICLVNLRQIKPRPPNGKCLSILLPISRVIAEFDLASLVREEIVHFCDVKWFLVVEAESEVAADRRALRMTTEEVNVSFFRLAKQSHSLIILASLIILSVSDAIAILVPLVKCADRRINMLVGDDMWVQLSQAVHGGLQGVEDIAWCAFNDALLNWHASIPLNKLSLHYCIHTRIEICLTLLTISIAFTVKAAPAATLRIFTAILHFVHAKS